MINIWTKVRNGEAPVEADLEDCQVRSQQKNIKRSSCFPHLYYAVSISLYFYRCLTTRNSIPFYMFQIASSSCSFSVNQSQGHLVLIYTLQVSSKDYMDPNSC